MKLTEEQIKAVESEAKRILVVAGAGAGKTTVLTERVRHLLKLGRSPSDIMVVTFTRKAAKELVDRMDNRSIRVGTFHSLCLRILKNHGDVIGYHPNMTVIEPSDADNLLEIVGQSLGLRSPAGSWKDGVTFHKLRQYMRRRAEGRDTGEMTAKVLKHMQSIEHQYYKSLREMNAVDYGMIMSEAVRLLEEVDAVRDAVQSSVSDLLIDELQDADSIQHRFHELLCPPANLFAVADSRQSIYGFRGAAPEKVVTSMMGDGFDSFTINDCFRCPAEIIDAANKVIEPHGLPDLQSKADSGRIKFMSGTLEDLARHVCQAVNVDGYSPGEVAVISRKHYVLNLLARHLESRDAPPFYLTGSTMKITDNHGFQTVYNLIRSMVNPNDDLAFRSIHACLGISGHDLMELRRKAKGSISGAYFGSSPKLNATGRVMAEATDSADAAVVAAKFSESLNWDRTADRDNVRGARQCSEFFATHYPGATCREAVSLFAMRDIDEALPDEVKEDHITLITAHSAKGLEWPCVFVAECNEGTYPSSMANTDEIMKEERRILYVSMTRASEELVIHINNEDLKKHPASRFLVESGLVQGKEKA